MLATGTFFIACKNDIKVVQELGEEDTAPFQTTFDGTYTFTDNGAIRNTLAAGKLEQFINDSDYTHVSEGLILEIYDRNQRLAGTLNADGGYYFEELNMMEAQGNVVFTNPKGDSLFTEKLIWLSDSNRIYTDELVRIVREGTEIRGRGMRANEDFSRYTILAPVGDIDVPDEMTSTDGSEEDQ